MLWCVGEWCEALSISSHPFVYESVGVALQHSDLAVRFAAARCLERFVVGVVGLDEEGRAQAIYASYVERLFRLLFALIDQLDELDNQTAIMQVIRHSVANLQSAVEPAVPLLLSSLPHLWTTAGQSNNPLRLSLLDTLTELTRALGHRSVALQSFSVQALRFALEPKASDREYLHAVALELWAAVVQNATTFTAQLLDLFPLLPSTFADHSLDLTESLPLALSLIESYALLGGRQFMSSHASTVASMVSGWMERVSDSGLILLSCALETLAQLFPAEFTGVFAQPLHSILRSLIDVQRYSELSEGEKASRSSVGLPSDLVCGHLLYVLSRVFFSSVDGGLKVVEEVAGGQSSEWLVRLVRLWLDQMDSVSEVYKKKLAVLAVGRILLSQPHNPALLQLTVDWLVAATSVHAELDRADADGDGAANAVTSAEVEAARLSAGTEVERRRLLSENDAANSAVVLSDVLTVLNALQGTHPPATFHQVVEQRIPPPIQAQLQHFIQHRHILPASSPSSQPNRLSSPLSATIPSSSSSSLFPPSSSSSSSLSTSHSHPSLQSLHTPNG